MTDLDLTAAKRRLAEWEAALDADHDSWLQLAAALAGYMPLLVAEIERYRRLLGDGSYPTSGAFEAMATALGQERASVERLWSLLGDILGHFHRYGMDGDRLLSMRSAAVPVETYTQWRSVLGGDPR